MSDCEDQQTIRITLEMTHNQLRNCLITEQYWYDEWQDIVVNYLAPDVYDETLDKMLTITPFMISRINNPTLKQCMIAVQSDGNALSFIEKQTDELCKEAVKQNGWAYHCIDPALKTMELYKQAREHPTNPYTLEWDK